MEQKTKYSSAYGRWDDFARALGEDRVDPMPERPAWAPQDAVKAASTAGDPTEPFDPTRVAAMRALLDEIDEGRKPHLEAGIKWLEHATLAFKNGAVPDDGDCPFEKGEEAWFWFVLLANKPHLTLHGPYRPLLARHRSPREQAILEGLCCARCYAAAGCWIRTPLKRCSGCKAVAYCGRACQKADFPAHRGDCRAFRKRNDEEAARLTAMRLDGVLPAKGDRRELRARHSLDGYGASVLALYEAEGDLDEIYTIVTVPTHDDVQRAALEPGEARFDVKRQSGIVKDLVDARLVTPIDPPPHQKLEPGQAFGRIEVPLPEQPAAPEPGAASTERYFENPEIPDLVERLPTDTTPFPAAAP